MVKDMTPQGAFLVSSEPVPFGFAGDRLVFSATALGLGEELWSTDGTVEGTVLLGDFCPGTAGSETLYLGAVHGRVVFSARVDCLDSRLFSTDGTPAGTAELLPESAYTFGRGAPATGSTSPTTPRLVFFGVDGSSQLALFASDGTPAGTSILAQPFAADIHLTYAGGKYYFSADHELWASDSTAAGTAPVAALPADSTIEQAATSVEPLLFFEVSEPTGRSLWRSDGSTAGTYRLVQFPGVENEVLSLETFGARAYLLLWDSSTGKEIWTSDGSSEGTYPVTNFGPEYAIADYSFPRAPFTALNGSVYFQANDGISGPQLWRAGPQAAAAFPLAPVCDEFPCWSQPPVAVGSSVFFVGVDESNGIEPRLTAGVAGDSTLVADLCPGPCASNPQFRFAGRGDEIGFSATPVYSAPPTLFLLGPQPGTLRQLSSELLGGPYGYEESRSAARAGALYFSARNRDSASSLWLLPPDANLALNLGPRGAENAGPSTAPDRLTAFSHELFFVMSTPEPPYPTLIVRSSGDEISTRIVDWTGGECTQDIYEFRVVGSRLLFLSQCFSGLQLWALDPGSNTPTLLREIDESLNRVIVAGDLLYLFTSSYPTYEVRLWTSDGTVSGTQPRFVVGGQSGGPYLFSAAGDHPVFFLYANGLNTLYTVSANLQSLVTLETFGQNVSFGEFVPAGRRAFFVSLQAGEASEVWSTDGTPAGTRTAALSPIGYALVSARETTSGFHLFLGDGNTTQLWYVDPAGSQGVLILTLPYTWHVLPNAGTAVADRSYFALQPTSQFFELWSTDGTVEGSGYVATVAAPYSSYPILAIQSVPGAILFAGYDAEHGQELWTAEPDGTQAHLLQDIFPGRGSSRPSQFAVVDDRVFFSADDGIHGRELWAMSLSGGAPCRTSSRALCLEGGRFRVEASWIDFAGRFGDATAVPISGDTGYFWFFDDANVEMILKLIDGTGYNGHHWVYYGALSNVEYTFTVTDSETGAAKRYYNPATRFASSGDIQAFGPQGAHASGGPAEATTRATAPPVVSLAAFSAPQGLPGACVPSTTRFCILNNRFAVEATWRDFAGNTGTANADTLTDDTGYLWFFDEANVEVVLKMVDGSGFNDHFWVYYGALSNVEYTLTVTDTVAGGPARIYHNALGQFGSFGDIEAFPAP